MSPSLIIDIETGPLADDRLMELWSSPPLPEAPAEFQPLRIRLKSRVDEKETEERIERARCAHLRKLDQHRRDLATSFRERLFAEGDVEIGSRGRTCHCGDRSDSGRRSHS